MQRVVASILVLPFFLAMLVLIRPTSTKYFRCILSLYFVAVFCRCIFFVDVFWLYFVCPLSVEIWSLHTIKYYLVSLYFAVFSHDIRDSYIVLIEMGR